MQALSWNDLLVVLSAPFSSWLRTIAVFSTPEMVCIFVGAPQVHDLRVYASVHDAVLSHYRDSTGLEVDAVIQTGMGSWIPVEVKLGSEESTVDAAAKNLLKFVNKVDQDRMGAPANMLVVTSSGFAFRRKDGVTVVPIGSLGP